LVAFICNLFFHSKDRKGKEKKVSTMSGKLVCPQTIVTSIKHGVCRFSSAHLASLPVRRRNCGLLYGVIFSCGKQEKNNFVMQPCISIDDKTRYCAESSRFKAFVVFNIEKAICLVKKNMNPDFAEAAFSVGVRN
jgi:hypothetical protein